MAGDMSPWTVLIQDEVSQGRTARKAFILVTKLVL